MPAWHRPPIPVAYQERDGSWKGDMLGRVFRPVPGEPMGYTYGAGPKDSKTKTIMFTCPMFAIPDEVFELLGLWNESRLLRLPVVAGGVLDQPLMVRKSFPAFEVEMAYVRDSRAQQHAQHAAIAAGASMAGALFGGRGQ